MQQILIEGELLKMTGAAARADDCRDIAGRQHFVDVTVDGGTDSGSRGGGEGQIIHYEDGDATVILSRWSVRPDGQVETVRPRVRARGIDLDDAHLAAAELHLEIRDTQAGDAFAGGVDYGRIDGQAF